MNPKLVKIIYKKEMLDTLRDRRTLISMILVPLLVFPVLTFGLVALMKAKTESTKKELQKVALIGEQYAPGFVSSLEAKNMFELVKEKDYISAIKQKKVALALEFSGDFEQRIASEDSAWVVIYLDEAEFKSSIALEKLNEQLDIYRDSIVSLRLKSRQLGQNLLKPISVVHKNVASKEKMGGFLLGTFLPYLIIVLSLSGAMYPAIDLTAGEKERGTMETILSSPASHLEITAGKFLTVLTASVITAILSLTSMGITVGLTLSQIGDIPQEMQVSIHPLSIVLLLVMILPVACLFSSLLLSIALFAKSYKEAQSYVTPLMFIVILPAMVSLIPGFELNTTAALVPVVNVSLGAKEILMGNFQWGHIGLIFLSNLIYASLSLFVTKRLFDKEEVLFRV
jgi:sodium transport system permease protein